MNEVVLDASAVLALLQEEPGGIVVEAQLTSAIISAVNLSEVVAQLIKHQMPEKLAVRVVSDLGLQTVAFDEEMAYHAAALTKITSRFGLSLGDRACLALAQKLKLPVITADRAWKKLNLGCEIRFLR